MTIQQTALLTGGSGFIGDSVRAELESRGWVAVSFDLQAPPSPHTPWIRGDICDVASVAQAIKDVSPTAVVHLAARTDTNSDSVADYPSNTAGTRVVAKAALKAPSVRRFLHTSTQYVAEPGADVADPLAFSPFTAYGESKAQSETIVREVLAGKKPFAIVRPTNVWGPRHPRYPQEFWRVLQRGLYLHPGDVPVMRTYGYLENVAWQYGQVLELGDADFDSSVWYLGDLPLDLRDWVDAFSVAVRGSRARRVPIRLVRFLAVVGDGLQRVRVPWPITSSRFKSMTTDYVVPTAETLDALGLPPWTLEEGVARTVEWLSTPGVKAS